MSTVSLPVLMMIGKMIGVHSVVRGGPDCYILNEILAKHMHTALFFSILTFLIWHMIVIIISYLQFIDEKFDCYSSSGIVIFYV